MGKKHIKKLPSKIIIEVADHMVLDIDLMVESIKDNYKGEIKKITKE